MGYCSGAQLQCTESVTISGDVVRSQATLFIYSAWLFGYHSAIVQGRWGRHLTLLRCKWTVLNTCSWSDGVSSDCVLWEGTEGMMKQLAKMCPVRSLDEYFRYSQQTLNMNKILFSGCSLSECLILIGCLWHSVVRYFCIMTAKLDILPLTMATYPWLLKSLSYHSVSSLSS